MKTWASRQESNPWPSEHRAGELYPPGLSIHWVTRTHGEQGHLISSHMFVRVRFLSETNIFSLSHARVMLINVPNFITEHKNSASLFTYIKWELFWNELYQLTLFFCTPFCYQRFQETFVANMGELDFLSPRFSFSFQVFYLIWARVEKKPKYFGVTGPGNAVNIL